MKLFLIIILVLVIVLVLLCYFDFNYKRITYENFDESNSEDVSGGASEYYGWGYKEKDDKKRRRKRHCDRCGDDYDYDDNREHICYVIDNSNDCSRCDITQNKDIDKYVLKSSVPPCPDMSQFATKNMLQPDVDLDNYVLKSDLPSVCGSYFPTRDQYILKTECVPQYVQTQCPDYSQYDITTHPDYKKVIKEKCVQYKRSWIQDFEEWWKSLFEKTPKINNDNIFPQSYGWSPYSGYSTSNNSYLLLDN